MGIKTVEITSIEARKFAKPGERHQNVRIDNNSTVTNITEINDQEAHIEYRYSATYGGLGLITLQGIIVFEGDASDLASKWGQEGNMPNEIASEVHTAVMRICVPEAIMISRDIKLPPPIPLPQINIKPKKGQKTTVHHGMEVA